MARRKNASFTGSALHGSGGGSRELVERFYASINLNIPGNTPVPIPPPESVHPKHDLTAQAFIFADYAVRKFAPIALKAAGNKTEATKLRTLPKIVDEDTAYAAEYAACEASVDAAEVAVASNACNTTFAATEAAAHAAATHDAAAYAATDAAYAAAYAAYAATHAAHAATYAANAATDAATLNPDATWEAVTEMLAAL